MSKTVDSKEALRIILCGGIIEFGERYYRYNSNDNTIEYSDYNQNNWKESTATIDNFVATSTGNWSIIKYYRY